MCVSAKLRTYIIYHFAPRVNIKGVKMCEYFVNIYLSRVLSAKNIADFGEKYSILHLEPLKIC